MLDLNEAQGGGKGEWEGYGNLELWNGRYYWCWSALQGESGNVENSFVILVSFFFGQGYVNLKGTLLLTLEYS